MDGHRDYYDKWSKSEKNTIWYHLYIESKIWHKWTYVQNRKKLTDMHNRLMTAKEGLSGGGRMGSLGLADADNYWLDKQQGLPAYHRTLYSISCEKP